MQKINLGHQKNRIDKIQKHCKKKKISQRQLAKLVPGLTQDRISKIFNGEIGHMTIDKLVVILVALDYKIEIKAKVKAKIKTGRAA